MELGETENLNIDQGQILLANTASTHWVYPVVIFNTRIRLVSCREIALFKHFLIIFKRFDYIFEREVLRCIILDFIYRYENLHPKHIIIIIRQTFPQNIINKKGLHHLLRIITQSTMIMNHKQRLWKMLHQDSKIMQVKLTFGIIWLQLLDVLCNLIHILFDNVGYIPYRSADKYLNGHLYDDVWAGESHGSWVVRD